MWCPGPSASHHRGVVCVCEVWYSSLSLEPKRLFDGSFIYLIHLFIIYIYPIFVWWNPGETPHPFGHQTGARSTHNRPRDNDGNNNPYNGGDKFSGHARPHPPACAREDTSSLPGVQDLVTPVTERRGTLDQRAARESTQGRKIKYKWDPAWGPGERSFMLVGYRLPLQGVDADWSVFGNVIDSFD